MENQDSKSSFNALQGLQILMFIFPIGALADAFFFISTFKQDPAPPLMSLIIDLVVATIYLASAVLVLQRKLWAVWITFTIYIFFSGIGILMYLSNESHRLPETADIEMFFRVILMITMIILYTQSSLIKSNQRK